MSSNEKNYHWQLSRTDMREELRGSLPITLLGFVLAFVFALIFASSITLPFLSTFVPQSSFAVCVQEARAQ